VSASIFARRQSIPLNLVAPSRFLGNVFQSFLDVCDVARPFASTRPRPIEYVNRNLPICTGFMPQDHVLSLYLLRVCAVHRLPDLQDSIASEALYVHSCKFKVLTALTLFSQNDFMATRPCMRSPLFGRR
jgi:hypothetical protein